MNIQRNLNKQKKCFIKLIPSKNNVTDNYARAKVVFLHSSKMYVSKNSNMSMIDYSFKRV